MAMQYNTGIPIVAITGSVSTGLTTPTAIQTIVNYTTGRAGSILANGAVLYTVTAGKTFYMTGFYTQGFGAAASFADNATEKVTFESTDVIVNFTSPIPFTHSVRVPLGTAGVAKRVNFWGYEQ